MAGLRTALYLILVSLLTMVVGGLISLAVVLPIGVRYWLFAIWRDAALALCRHVLGVRHRVLGRENMPTEPSVVMAKHQSAWETVGLQAIFPPLVFVFKKELLRVPFFGWSLAAMKMISIDRAAAKDALKQVVEKGRERLAAGYWVVIFPEGTRVAPGTTSRYKPGGAQLAVRSGAKVVPVAHDAGEIWPKSRFAISPGLITVSIGPPIDPAGKSAAKINALAATWIESEMRRISPHRYPSVTEAVAA
ncbi:MAG TPA: lysophospholipid acyltransferase family protein [Accumulibacter sp.]|uniref:lysophospholipid acyltransferase family protein n=1 Tax=Accumulibacter sp. TaxID=2053492 RepID=UPI0025E98C16|nr:lysophospholipid acyltransferase family protein [Accumulibacter sp.]MCM8600402.1 1-acyl-sn-glycerol-3-phosphate acyltransferase [Accumulibacter sp.]MCM8664668.1 1-acyl-sn-glycerol-3-phosphate acyltransferase [Accumulibacter sp.]HNC53494.1 lysophospholipid acyltransferase family protein [Accumulibacter sp.]